MARDLIIAKDGKTTATLVHDEPDLKVKSLVVHSDGLYARTDGGLVPVGQLTRALMEDLACCDRCYVVAMDGNRVLRTTEARLQKER